MPSNVSGWGRSLASGHVPGDPAVFRSQRCPPQGLWMAELRTRLLQSVRCEYGFCSVGLICIWCLECLVMERASALFWVMRAEVSNQCFSVYPVSSVIWVTSNCVAHRSEVLRVSIYKLDFCRPAHCRLLNDIIEEETVFTNGISLPMSFQDRCLFKPLQMLVSPLANYFISRVSGKPREREGQGRRLILSVTWDHVGCFLESRWIIHDEMNEGILLNWCSRKGLTRLWSRWCWSEGVRTYETWSLVVFFL